MKPFYSLLLVLAFASCSGQNPHTVKENIPEGQPKIVKTQGTSQYTSINCSIQDKAGNLWFSTGGEGVYCYDGKLFTNFTIKDGLCSNIICAILEDKNGAIWFGTDAGLCRYNPLDKTFTAVSIPITDDGNYTPFVGKAFTNAQPIVRSMLQDKKGTIWIGTDNHGVYCYDPSAGLRTGSKTFTHFLHNDSVANKNRLQLIAVTDMMEDSDGNIWFTTWFEGVCRFDGKAITNLKPFGEVWFASILQDKNGDIWVGSRSRGAYRFSPSATFVTGSETYTKFTDVEIFNACCITAMAEDKEGNMWFGSEFSNLATREDYGGVWSYNPTTKTFTNFTTNNGLSHNSVFSVTIDKTGKIWIGTRTMGLCRYNPTTKTFTNFSDNATK